MKIYLLDLMKNGMFRFSCYFFNDDYVSNTQYVLNEAKRRHDLNRQIYVTMVISGNQIADLIGDFFDIYCRGIQL